MASSNEEIKWNHPIHGFELPGVMALAFQLRDLHEVETRRPFVRAQVPAVGNVRTYGLRISPHHYLAISSNR